MTTPNYSQYLISAINDESAQTFAKENGFEDNTWFRLPSTLNDDTEAFIKDITPIFKKGEVEAKEEPTEERLSGDRNSHILFAKDFRAASKYASRRNWKLNAWKFVSSPELEEVIEYSYYC